jgi:uncharacterized phiE125 gp8 family phage protein
MHWNRLTRTAAPTTPIIALDEAQDHLRVDGDDAAVQRCIDAATAAIDGTTGIGVAMITQDWQLTLPCFEWCVHLSLTPVQSVNSITYRTSGGWVTVDPSLYHVDLSSTPARVTFIGTVPCCYPGDIRIDVTCGYGDTAADVPADLRQAALLMVGHYYEFREATAANTMAPLPMGVETILARHRAVPIA